MTENPSAPSPLAVLGPDRVRLLAERFRTEALADPLTADYFERTSLTWAVEGGQPHEGFRSLFPDSHLYALAVGHLLTAGWESGVPEDQLLAMVSGMAEHRPLLVAGAVKVLAGGGDDRPLYDQLGQQNVRDLLDRFYSLMVGDPVTSPYFAHTDMTSLKRHMARMVSQALGGPMSYGDEALRVAHARIRGAGGERLAIDDRVFARTAAHMLGTCWERGVPEHIVMTLAVALLGKRATVTGAGTEAAPVPVG